MEYTEEEILDVVQRWDHTGLLYGLPLYEKQELAPIFDNASRIALSTNLPFEVSDKLEDVMFPICRRLYRRVGSEFDIEKMINTLIKEVTEKKDFLISEPKDKSSNPIVEFCVHFADNYEDEVISKKQFSDEEYEERVEKILGVMRDILLNKDMVSFMDRTNSDWKIMLSDSKKSPKQTRYWNQKVVQETLASIIRDTNKGI